MYATFNRSIWKSLDLFSSCVNDERLPYCTKNIGLITVDLNQLSDNYLYIGFSL